MEENKLKYNRMRGRKKASRLLSLVLCVLTVLEVLLMPVFGAGEASPALVGNSRLSEDQEAGVTVADGTYALVVSTGIVPGATITYFGIRYMDTKGTERTFFVFPHEDTLRKSYELASAVASPDARLSHVKTTTGYEPKNKASKQDGLTSYSLDTYIFRPYFDIGSVIGIDVFMRHANKDEGVKSEWTCSDIRLYSVEKMYGMSMAGYYSDTYTIDFRGRLLADFEKKQASGGDFSVAESNKVYQIGREAYAPYTLNLYKKGEGAVYDSLEVRKTYLFRLDISDIYGGGIEALANEYSDKKAKIEAMSPVEALTLHLKYTDTFGNTRKITIPFITSFIGWATEYFGAIKNESVIGIAQQGDTILFEGFLPDCSELTGCTFFYGVYEKKYETDDGGSETVQNSAEAEANIESTLSRKKSRYKALKSDVLSYSGFSIFDAEKVQSDVWLDGAMLRCTTIGTPLMYYRAPTTAGIRVESGTERNLFDDFRKVEEGDGKSVTLLPKPSDEQYVFEIVTDNVEGAGTNLDISAVLKYKTVDGVEKTSAPLSIKSAVSNYYGYWSGNGAELSYLAGASENGKMVFALNYPGVDYFESIELSINFNGKDDPWQMHSLAIYRVNGLVQRNASWLDNDLSVGKYSTDRLIYRDFPRTNRLQYTDKKILIGEGHEKVLIKFDENGHSSTEDQEIDWERIKESMTYNETLQDLGFAKVRYVYEVGVKVFSNENASDTYGDCGSNNNFYYQLVFEKGMTAYVLANQQLTSDGFRAGQTESFRISSNRDYGNLQAIRIIPDDTLSEEDIYDKINIESITVTQIDLGGLSKGWRVENVGWIGIDYRDPGAQATIRGQKLRSESEMARNYLLDSTGYKMNFLVAIATGEYPEGYGRYEGTLTATVYYNTNNDEFANAEVDVAEAIGIYAGKNTIFDSEEKPDAALGNKKRKQIDTTYMLRENHIDRFVVSLENVKTILGITFHVAGTVTTTWNLTNIDVYRIVSDGMLVLNSRGEYQRDGEITHICSGTKVNGYSVPVTMDARTGAPDPKDLETNFTDNVITIDKEAWETIIERVPAGDNDTLNIYLYLKDDVSKIKTEDLETLTLSVKYQMRDIDKPYQVKAKNLSISDEKNMLFVRGVGVKGLSILHEISVKSRAEMKIDYAIVQQVRAGVMLNTFYMPFYSADAEYGVTGYPTAKSDIQSEEQIVSMQFSDKTADLILEGDTNIAVMIGYTNINEVGETIYDSAFIYLTDQNVASIRAGKRVDLVFNENCVREIKQIAVAGLGAFDATIENALVSTYRTDSNGTKIRTGQYSVTGPIAVTRSKLRFNCTKVEVGDLEVTFSLGEEGSFTDGTIGKISMDLNVVDDFMENKTLHYEDITPFVSSGSFVPGQSATIRLLIPGVKSIRSIELEPHSTTDKAASFTLTTLTGKWCVGNSETGFSRLVGKTVREKEPYTVNLNDVEILLNAKLINAEGEITQNRTYKAGTVSMTAVPGEHFELDCEAVNSLDGFGCKISAAYADSKTADQMLTMNGTTCVFTPEYPEEGETEYVITVVSQENENVSLTLQVTASAQ